MNKLLIISAAFISVFVSGCGFITPRISEEEAFKYDRKYLAEHEVWMQTQQNTMIEKWIQAANKKEECKIYVGTSSTNDRTLHPDHRVFWDGQCKDGYAYGLGREFEKGFLTDFEAIALYSEKKEKPKYYYQRDKLKNSTVEGLLTRDNAYIVITEIKDNFGFDIKLTYGKSNTNGKFPRYLIITSPLQDHITYVKDYGNFGSRFFDLSKADSDKNFLFSIIDVNTKNPNGFEFAILKNGQRLSSETINGTVSRLVELPDTYYENAQKIYSEIVEAGQKALDAQVTALQVKQQYKEKICSDNVKVDFIDNSEYKAICEEDKYMAEIKIKLDKELEKIAARKAQDRMIRAREAEAMAAQQQAAAAQQQANTVAWASFNQSMHNMNMNNQMQQLNNNLFMLNRSPQQINVDHTIRTSNSPMWTPVR